jgi:hypothetical protein
MVNEGNHSQVVSSLTNKPNQAAFLLHDHQAATKRHEGSTRNEPTRFEFVGHRASGDCPFELLYCHGPRGVENPDENGFYKHGVFMTVLENSFPGLEVDISDRGGKIFQCAPHLLVADALAKCIELQ